MKVAVTKVIDTLTQEDFHESLQSLLERYNKFIAAGGDCSEGGLNFMCVLSIKMPIQKSLETYLIILVCDLVWFGLWYINHSRLFSAKPGKYIYIKYIWFVKTFLK